MKKVLKSSLLMLVMAVMLFAMVGCGQDKIVATKTSTSEEEFLGISGEIKETIEVTFKKDKVEKMTWTMEFENAEAAKSMYGLYLMASSEIEGMEVEKDDKKVIMKLDAVAYSKMQDVDEADLSKEKLIETLKEEGYTVK